MIGCLNHWAKEAACLLGLQQFDLEGREIYFFFKTQTYKNNILTN